MTYGEICHFMEEFAALQMERAVVFCLCENVVGAVAGYLALVEQRMVPLLLSARIDRELLANLLEQYQPAYLWIPQQLKALFPYDCICSSHGYLLLKTGRSPYPLHGDLQLLMTTSGSTGSPKLVRYKKGNLEANAKNVALAFGWTSQERAIADLGMQYTMGLNVINTHLYAGATVLLASSNLMSEAFWDYIAKERATNFTGVPLSYEILRRLNFTKMDLPYLRTLAQGGGKLPDKRFQEFAEYAAQSGKRFCATFGTTETAARMSLLPPELALMKPGSIGKAIPDGEMYLVDSEGNVLENAVAEGELCYRGPNVTMGYAQCKEDLQNGDEWQGVYRTGDLARRDADGFYYITGRLSRFLKLNGYRIGLDECEHMIRQAFRVDCACTGTDKRMEIYIDDAALLDKVQLYISDKTGLFKALFHVRYTEQIPRNEVGKVKYGALGMEESAGYV